VGYKELTGWRGKVLCEGRIEVRGNVKKNRADKFWFTKMSPNGDCISILRQELN
jgi:hypothetical protein